MTRAEAVAALKATRELSTDLLPALGISFEAWLRFAELQTDRQRELTEKLIRMFEAEAAGIDPRSVVRS